MPAEKTLGEKAAWELFQALRHLSDAQQYFLNDDMFDQVKDMKDQVQALYASINLKYNG